MSQVTVAKLAGIGSTRKIGRVIDNSKGMLLTIYRLAKGCQPGRGRKRVFRESGTQTGAPPPPPSFFEPQTCLIHPLLLNVVPVCNSLVDFVDTYCWAEPRLVSRDAQFMSHAAGN
ncbi:hypothetical protein H113_00793 [Trichophyton rubrum MR1459]|nr:hypothetical protein H113_00793 [Trichophyton rubrum MR1459]EZG10523.1 hypothetical protein H106_00586 [Trichophyton rubrum CBS 735.88]